MLKKCTKCGRKKLLQEYSKHPNNADRLQSMCKSCDKKRQRKWYKKNKKREQEKRKKWQENNKELHNEHVRDYYARKKRSDYAQKK